MKLIGIEEFKSAKTGEVFYKIYATKTTPNRKATNAKGEYPYYYYNRRTNSNDFPLVSESSFKAAVSNGLAVGCEIDFVYNPVDKRYQIQVVK